MLCFFTRTWLACWDIKIFQFCKRSIKQKISKRDIKKARQKNISILQTLHIATTNKTGKRKAFPIIPRPFSFSLLSPLLLVAGEKNKMGW